MQLVDTKIVNFEKVREMESYIKEEEFEAYERQKLQNYSLRFKEIINKEGESIYDIAKGTGLQWSTVNRLRKGKIISFKALCRIERYLKSKGILL